MADGEYRRLGCAADRCDGIHKAKGYCLRHYRQWQRGGVKTDSSACVHCHAQMAGKIAGSMYCSKRCKLAAWKASNHERSNALPSNQRTLDAIYAGYCLTCGSAFVSRRARKYCKESCAPSVIAPKRYKLGVHYKPPVRICKHCGLQWCAIRRVGPGPYCPSPECEEARKAERRKANSHGTHIDRARKHGRRYGYWNVMRVFERDKWTCKLCGVKTPKKLRGTMDPRAPELDHILPISQGGDHVIENCQCACRKCNGEKGATAIGQMWLTGFADTIS